MEVDYIIVGLGLAGLAFIEILEKNNKAYVVFENESQNSSKVAAGMYNPVILKRFTPVWNGTKQLQVALPFFKKLEDKFKAKYLQDVPIYRVFKSIEEQNNWFTACDKPLLTEYMDVKLIPNTKKEIIAPFGFGKLKHTGKLDVNRLLKDYTAYLEEKNTIQKETFYHNDLEIGEVKIRYKKIKATQIVFCEGFGLKDNPFFNYLPMNEAKGELITIHAPKLQINYLLKAAVFVLPLGQDLYKVGATFNWKDKTQKPSKAGEMELLMKLDMTINTPYTIVNHVAGIRPTVKDRRPLLGIHPKHKQLAILNGLGTRGVMLAPTMAKSLYLHIENKTPLDKETDISRFSI